MGSKFGDTWEIPGGGFFEFAVKRALKQDQIVHLEGKLQFILYFSRECSSKYNFGNANQISYDIIFYCFGFPKSSMIESLFYYIVRTYDIMFWEYHSEIALFQLND